jgi:hypothetical protein
MAQDFHHKVMNCNVTPFNGKIFCLFFFILFALHGRAQTTTPLNEKEIDLKSSRVQEKLHVQFNIANEAENLLVMVRDANGDLVYLDTRYHFKGTYEKDIDLGEKKDRSCVLHIAADGKKIQKQLQ